MADPTNIKEVVKSLAERINQVVINFCNEKHLIRHNFYFDDNKLPKKNGQQHEKAPYLERLDALVIDAMGLENDEQRLLYAI